ncbi:aminotransferase class V-fold PLP-dependent enzyme [Planococcus beigongshangi]|uniref:aminotransferase class V-fold PLP-dependent enzyme n=1 Tax=Planococcus beigongshangi TaxID=2782536 RepID=UPI00193B1E0E|nr:aminotransferase class V-fold PLP-dependent enzyme [Planococcus beigongshangi]
MEQRKLTYRIASEPDEMNQIHQLNYETFVEEIPQHQQNQDRRLVDKFDQENIYIIAKDGEEVVGMIALRITRPFSLDQKLDDLDRYLPEGAKPCEVRLLSVKKSYRRTLVFYQLVNELVSYCLAADFDLALISGTDRQIKLYKRIGFEPFGDMVGTEGAMFQPMYLTKAKFETTSIAFSKMMQRKSPAKPLNFLPGPVAIHREVEAAFGQPAISHRSEAFIEEMKTVRHKLCTLVNAEHAGIAVGTGTMANDLVAAQIRKLPGKGLILANGEFGYRLIDHATRFDLPFETLAKSWNDPISIQEVEHLLKLDRDITWLWTVHCETSTGALYDLDSLKALTKSHGVKLCVDACSSVGIVPVDLKGVHLASNVSGKGLGAYPGLAVVFHQEPVWPDTSIPRYLDLGQYAVADSIPYTHSSNLVAALHTALNRIDLDTRQQTGHAAREMLGNAGFTVLGDNSYSPGILTIPLPALISSDEIGTQLKEEGIIVSYESDYLLERNWIQFALMGELTLADFGNALAVLRKTIRRKAELV